VGTIAPVASDSFVTDSAADQDAAATKQIGPTPDPGIDAANAACHAR
jgi:hypothetical protein